MEVQEGQDALTTPTMDTVAMNGDWRTGGRSPVD